MSDDTDSNLVWVDCEMTGLNPSDDRLLELAILITDKDLKLIPSKENPCEPASLVIAIHQPPEVLRKIDPEWYTLHKRNGLIARVQASLYTEKTASEKIISFLKEYTSGNPIICGNSIHMDRAFIRQWMPELNEFLFYRMIDVSSFKECFKRWCPNVVRAAESKKRNTHSALADIQDSIAELSVYKELLMKGI